ncbi:MAG: hypothetical protein ACRDV6_09445 [Acidimicrobiales bacterium]
MPNLSNQFIALPADHRAARDGARALAETHPDRLVPDYEVIDKTRAAIQASAESRLVGGTA